MKSSSFWKMKAKELRELGEAGPQFTPLNIGDVAVVCHTSSQSQLLTRMIHSAKQITDKIIILDDCSRDDTIQVAADLGCEVHSIPEGWIYTHGFGALIKYQQKLCQGVSEWHLQLDTGEFLYVDPDITYALEDKLYYWTLRINLDEQQFRQPMLNRLFRSNAPLTFPTIIHGSPFEPQQYQRRLRHAEFLIFHHNNIGVKDTYYGKRKNRLYWKLLKKGYEQGTLHNRHWENEFKSKQENYEKMIIELENNIGPLEETDKPITLVHKGDW